MSNDKRNKMYGTGTGVTQQVVGYVPVPAKLTSIGENDPDPLFDAFNIDWASGKYSYDGNPEHIIESTGHLVELVNSKATTADFTEPFEQLTARTQVMLYKTSSNQSNEQEPYVNQNSITNSSYFNSGTNNTGWALTKNAAGTSGDGTGQYVWMSSYYFEYKLSDNSFIGWQGPTSTPILLKGERGNSGKPADYFEQRWATYISTFVPVADDINIESVNYSDINCSWKLEPVYEDNQNTWLTSRKVEYVTDGNDGWTAEFANNSNWSDPIKINGTDGEANPIQPVLKYTWHTSYNDGTPNCWPSYTISQQNPGNNWTESPNNPTSTNIYLWMIQGQRHNGSMMDLDETASERYWYDPVCLSGKDGEPGKDGDDLEFIYRIYEGPQNFDDTTLSDYDRPQVWDENTEDDYKGDGEDGYSQATIKWTDNPTGVDATHRYEYCAYRRKTGETGNKEWEKFSKPFAWSVYGENGVDGDGVEYIFTTMPILSGTNNYEINKITTTNANFAASQTSEWGINIDNTPVYCGYILHGTSHGGITLDKFYGCWHDDPQSVDGTNPNQKYQYVSTRKYREITYSSYVNLCDNSSKMSYDPDTLVVKYNNNSLGVKIGDKAWFPYSTPELWNWYVEDGTSADRIVMLYKRTGSATDYGNMPKSDEGYPYSYTISAQTVWHESPGNNTGASTAYLWMTSNYYSNKKHTGTDTIYTVTDNWQTPICLTGEPGHDGEDGTDIEFIYFRTSEDNWPFGDLDDYNNIDVSLLNANQTDDYPCNLTTSDDIKYYDPEGTFNNPASGDLHDVWTDNPLGVTHEYDREYVAIRKKVNKQWIQFCKPFLWSKFGEDGLDGDGVEYIFCQVGENEEDFQGKKYNPAEWDANQKDEYLGQDESSYAEWQAIPIIWTDDPSGVGINNRYEYVSVRKKRAITNDNKSDFISDWDHGDEYTVGSGASAHTYTIGDKVWFKYSEPAIWAHFASDALAINLTLESDNDTMAVSIDDNNVVTSNVSSTAYFVLYHNTLKVDPNYYNMNIVNSNINNGEIGYDNVNSYSYLRTTINNSTYILGRLSYYNNASASTYYLTTDIPAELDMTTLSNELRITSCAYITNNDFDDSGIIEVGTERIFTNKVNGLHLSIDDIYQLQLDRNVIKRDANNALDTVTVKLKSLTSNSIIATPSDALTKKLYLFVDETVIDDSFTINFGQYSPGTESHKFELIYDDMVHTPITLDTEYVSVVGDGKDGNPGVDGKSQEYIYMLTDDVDFFSNSGLSNYYKPQNWKGWVVSTAFPKDDYPFISSHGNYEINGISYVTYVLNNAGHNKFWANYRQYDSEVNAYAYVWTDNPQGVSERYPYEFMASRSYNTSRIDGNPNNNVIGWETFSTPQPWSTWGHQGVDGDGVEYIYYLCNSGNYTFTNDENPCDWLNDSNYQNQEYIRNASNSDWTDNPSGVGEDSAYEYVSVRKFREVTQTDIDNGLVPTEFAVGDKCWLKYSTPTIWAKYGKDGLPGINGSGFVLDFSNPVIQIAVNSDNTVKPEQEVSSEIKLYNGASAIANNKFTITYTNPFGNSHSNWLTLSGKTLTVDIPSTITGTVPTITSNSAIEVTANSTDYELSNFKKNIKLIPVKYGADGEPAQTFELHCAYSVLHYNTIDDSPSFTQDTVEYKIKHLTGHSTELLEYSNFPSDLFISYVVNLKSSNSGSWGVSGSWGTRGGSFGDITNGGEVGKETDQGNERENEGGTQHTSGLQYTGDLYTGPIPVNELNNGVLENILSIDVYLNHILTQTTSEIWDEDYLEAVWDGINGTDGNYDEYIYYRPVGSTKITWIGTDNPAYVNGDTNDNTKLNPSWWTPNGAVINDYSYVGKSDFIPPAQQSNWLDHPQGVDDNNQYEYYSRRTFDGSAGTWGRYSSPVLWSNWGIEGKDGDGVEYIYYRNDSDTFDGPNPTNWTTDEDFQSSEHINTEVNLSEYYGDYVSSYLTFEALGSGNITLTIPANVGTSCVTSVSYRKNREAWTTTANSSSVVTITVPVVGGDTVQWKGTATKYSNGITTDNYNDTIQDLSTYASNFDATCNYNIYGNIMSLLHGDNFVNKIELTTEFTFAGLFGTYDTSRTRLKNAENLVLPAIILTNGCYTYMLSCNTALKTCPKILPYRGIGLTRMYQSMFANCCKTSDLATESIAAPLILCKGSTANNCWMYRMFGSAQYINKVELWIDYYYYNSESSHNRYGFDYFLQNNKKNGTIIQHGSADLSAIYDFRDIPNNTQDEHDVVSSATPGTNYPYNWTIETSDEKIIWKIWTDNPQGVNENNKYEWVSVRKYKEVTGDDTEILTNFEVGQKAWHPYSEPKLWSNYGEGNDGAPGDFKSTVFTRRETQPSTPSGGRYDNPIPTDMDSHDNLIWSDEIPNGSNPLWASTGTFKYGDNNGPTSGWSTPRLMADTDTYDVEFAYAETPGDPTNNPSNWYDPTSSQLPSGKNWSDMIWRAERNKTPGGTWGSWVITRIKGEKGDPGEGSFTLDWDNDNIGIAVTEEGIIKSLTSGNITRTSDLVLISDRYEFDSASMVDRNTITSSNNNIFSITATGNTPIISTDKIYVYITYIDDHTIRLTSVIKKNANISSAMNESGEWIKFDFKLYDTDAATTISFAKTMHFTPQHIGEDGDPAVTYEIIPSVNAIYKDGDTISPTTLSYVVNKYEGTSISPLPNSAFSSSLYARWATTNASANFGTSIINISADIGTTVSYINLELISNSNVIDRETIPIVRRGEQGGQGSQGFTGPIVRYTGEYNASKQYLTGKYNSNYDGTSILYKDIVWDTTNKKYYTPVQNDHYLTAESSSIGGCIGAGYINSGHSPSDANASNYWIEAKQFDFVATKLLYADQALVNQLSTHDLIATNSDGYPVAGITSGAAAMKNKDNQNILSPLDPSQNTIANGTTITNSGTSDNPTSGNNGSSVRIFAGEIKKGTSYSLTYAPFNVRQDGTAYMTNAYVKGEITADALKLGSGSFWSCDNNNESKTLPQIHSNETRQFIILTNNNTGIYVDTFSSSDTVELSQGAQATTETLTTNKKRIHLKANKLYQLISVGHQWNVTEITLKIPDNLTEYYDCRNDVRLYGSTLASYIYWDRTGQQYLWSYIDTGDKFISYYMEKQNNSLWPVKTQKVYFKPNDSNRPGDLIRQSNSYFYGGNSDSVLPSSDPEYENHLGDYISTTTIKNKKIRIEFSFLTYVNENYRTLQGVNLNLGSIYWSSANNMIPSNS